MYIEPSSWDSPCWAAEVPPDEEELPDSRDISDILVGCKAKGTGPPVELLGEVFLEEQSAKCPEEEQSDSFLVTSCSSFCVTSSHYNTKHS